MSEKIQKREGGPTKNVSTSELGAKVPQRGRRIYGLLGCALILPCIFTLEGCKSEKTQSKRNRVLSVITKLVEKGLVDQIITVSGEIKARQAAPLVFQAPGVVKRVVVEPGSQVKEGQVLVELQDEHTTVQLYWAKVQLRMKELEYGRAQKLHAEKVFHRSHLDKVATELASARFELSKAQLSHDQTKVKAPFSGHVGFFQLNGKQLSPGSVIQQGQEFGKIVSNDSIVEFELSEEDAKQVNVGHRVLVQLSGVEAILPLATKISHKEPFSASVTHMLKFQASLDRPNVRLQDGSFAKVSVALKDAVPALLVPQEAVIPEGGQYLVYTVRDTGEKLEQEPLFVAKAIHVTPGPQRGELISIGEKVQGLEPGDKVITEPAEMMGDGLPVTLSKQS